ncbi:MAG: GNAT family N-acetyltransferase [Deltaproteobacteria bacterium]|nr:MAG: GNAT family N-acetyltransferase [Deltaproteobacteria bacterium]
MDIRAANKEDFTRVLEIERMSFSKPWDYKFLEGASKDIFLVSGDSEIYGFLIAGCCFRNVNATVLKIAVHPEHRREGIATKLLYRLFEILKGKEVTEIDVFVEGAWKSAISLYKKVGFEITSTIPLTSDRNEFYVMRRNLSED